MISKTRISAQQPRGRQLNAKVCGCKSAIFYLFFFLRYDHFLQTTITRKWFKCSQNRCLSQHRAIRPLSVFIATNSPWLIKLFTALPGCCPLRRTPFSNTVCMHTRSLFPKPNTTVHPRKVIQENKKHVKRCRDGMPKSMQTR